MQNVVLINNSKTCLLKFQCQFLNFSDNLLQDAYIMFPNDVDHFEVAHETCSVLVWGAVPPSKWSLLPAVLVLIEALSFFAGYKIWLKLTYMSSIRHFVPHYIQFAAHQASLQLHIHINVIIVATMHSVSTKLQRNRMDPDQLPWFIIFNSTAFILSQRGDSVKIHLLAMAVVVSYWLPLFLKSILNPSSFYPQGEHQNTKSYYIHAKTPR